MTDDVLSPTASDLAPDGEAADAGGLAPAADELMPIVEALIFASPDPVTPKILQKLLDGEPAETIDATIAALKQRYAEDRCGLQLVEVAGGYQIVTRPELHEWVRRLFHERTTQKLSVAALETLAVIAYKQPVTAAEVAEIRGVNTAGVLSTLLDRKLIKMAGRKPVVGRPFMYATTREFLDRFGLKDLNDLPDVEDMADVLGFDLQGLDAPPPATLPFDAEPGPAGGADMLDDLAAPDEVVVAADAPVAGARPADVAAPLAEPGPGHADDAPDR
jgi:segregation and condensation protein B